MAYTTGIKRLKSYKGYGGKQSSVGSIPSIEFSVTQEGGTPEQILQEILKRKPSSYEVNWGKTDG
jgi:hypothetical protein